VQQLGRAADALAGGDWEQKIRPSGILEINALGQAFTSMTTQLREVYAGLEDKVKERTREVERRAAQIATGAEISHAASQELNPEQLLQSVVELIRERFDLYYAAVFLVDVAGQNAVLRAGTGEPGRIMLERAHKLEVGGNSMVGWACANKQARIALDVGDEPVRFANPLLPKTRSEMALPLRIGGRVLGALDIQSAQAQAFDSDDITALQGMADQIAVALENARLFQQAQTSLQEFEQANRLLTQQGWQVFLQARPAEFAEFHQTGAEALTPADMDGASQAFDAQRPMYCVPLTVHDQVIGELVVEPLGAGERTAAQQAVDLELLETVAAQVAQTIDGARLFEESQRRAAREQVVGQVATQMRETLNVDAVLQTAVREMRQALGIAEVEVRLDTAQLSKVE
jgi:GAF domain-containing protein